MHQTRVLANHVQHSENRLLPFPNLFTMLQIKFILFQQSHTFANQTQLFQINFNFLQIKLIPLEVKVIFSIPSPLPLARIWLSISYPRMLSDGRVRNNLNININLTFLKIQTIFLHQNYAFENQIYSLGHSYYRENRENANNNDRPSIIILFT